MKLSRRFLVGSTLVLLVVAIGYVIVPEDDKEEKLTAVYMAKETIAPGELVTKEMLEEKKVAKPDPWMLTDLKEIEDLRTTRTILAKRYMDKGDFNEDSPLIYADNEGEYTIRVKAENVNGGRLQAGDMVHVLYVAKPQGGDPSLESTKSEYSVRDLMVLSIRTQYAQDVNETKQGDANNIPAAVTLKVNEEQAAKLAEDQEKGTLSIFVLRQGEEAK